MAAGDARITPCLCYDGTALEAATFYASTFPDSAIRRVDRKPGSGADGDAGGVLCVAFTVLGLDLLGLNAGPGFRFTEAMSFQVFTDDQAQTDRYWDAVVDNGGAASRCGWCRDRWGLSWQIVPRALIQAMTSTEPGVSGRAMAAMMKMGKIDIAAIEAAVRG